MSAKTSIQWCDATWNPVRGCSRVSEGCRNCYAEGIAARFSNPGAPFHLFADRKRSGSKWTGRVELIPAKLEEPLHWREPRRIFVNSMSDLFHENLPISDILRVFETMAAAKQHTFQILTKRPARMRYCLSYPDDRLVCESAEHHRLLCTMPLPNVWMGVSVEDQKTADERIPLLLRTPAVVRFVSYEPALGPVDFTRWLSPCTYYCDHDEWGGGHRPSSGLDQVIVGGESGNSARPFDITWARNVIRQCKHAGCACFVKQLGKHPYPGRLGNGRMPDLALRDGHGGEMTEWPEDLQVREFPGSAVARGTA